MNFRKVHNPKRVQRIVHATSVFDLLIETIESAIASRNGASLEEINKDLIIRGLEMGFLDILAKEYKDLTPLLLDNFDYDDKAEKFHLRKERKFRTQLPVEVRIKYYLVSFLKRMESEGNYPTTDQVILHIMPLLKNGVTPENQTILTELEKIAEKVGTDSWRLKRGGTIEMDFFQ